MLRTVDYIFKYLCLKFRNNDKKKKKIKEKLALFQTRWWQFHDCTVASGKNVEDYQKRNKSCNKYLQNIVRLWKSDMKKLLKNKIF